MIIITDKVGQLANRIFQFSFVIANAIENNYKVLNLNFDDYAEYFEATSNSKFDEFQIKTTLISDYSKTDKIGINAINKLSHFFKKNNFTKNFILEHLFFENERFDLNDVSLQKIVKSKLIFLGGAWYFDYSNFIKHANLIKRFFTPIKKYQNKIEEIYKEIFEENTLLVGVHIRKGDYKEFMDGLHYLENTIYAERMEQAQNLLSEQGKKIKFVLCSNEPIELNDFKKYKVYHNHNHFIVDLYLLAKCNYIMGPLSTFSMWASFYGKVPLWQISKEKIDLKFTDFQIKEYC